MSIADKITRLQAAKTAIGTAITAKGGTVAAGDGFEDFAADVGTIPAGGTAEPGWSWHRPSNYPDLDSLTIGEHEVCRIWSCVPPTEQTEYTLKVRYWGFTATYYVGNIVNGELVVEATYNQAQASVLIEIPCVGTKVIKSVPSGTETSWQSMNNTSIPWLAEEYVYRQSMEPNNYTSPIHWKTFHSRTTFGNSEYNSKKYSFVEHVEPVYALNSSWNQAMRGCQAIRIKGLSPAFAPTSLNLFMYQTILDDECVYEILKNVDTSQCTSFSSMFSTNTKIRALNFISGWNTSAVMDMSGMFSSCSSLTALDISGWDTSAVTNMSSMFISCSSLTALDISEWDTSAVTNMNRMFDSCSSLTDFNSCTFRLSVNFGGSSLLTHDSLMSIINKLATVQTTQTLTIGSTNRAKLTAEEIAIATAKGWTVA